MVRKAGKIITGPDNIGIFLQNACIAGNGHGRFPAVTGNHDNLDTGALDFLDGLYGFWADIITDTDDADKNQPVLRDLFTGNRPFTDEKSQHADGVLGIAHHGFIKGLFHVPRKDGFLSFCVKVLVSGGKEFFRSPFDKAQIIGPRHMGPGIFIGTVKRYKMGPCHTKIRLIAFHISAQGRFRHVPANDLALFVHSS
ncbi:unknown [Acidaminococcus intestini CAG:325]|nr:unknown [Acidaminococcus intestini CAG:325]